MRDKNIYDEVEIEDMTYDPTLKIYHYPCPCGDRFEISLETLRTVEDRAIALCPSCSLKISVIYDIYDLPDDDEEPTTTLITPTAVAITA